MNRMNVVDYGTLLNEASKEIFEQFYLQPTTGIKKQNPYQAPVEREIHGAQHASRVTGYVGILVKTLQILKHELAKEISTEELFLLQIAALFHDAERKNDTSEDTWESESIQACLAFLVKKNYCSEEQANRIANLIDHHPNPKDTPKEAFMRRVLQTADSLDIIRVRSDFYLRYCLLFRDFDKLGKVDILKSISKEVATLIANQHDLTGNCDLFVDSFGSLGPYTSIQLLDEKHLEWKTSYEFSPNLFDKIVREFENYPYLSPSEYTLTKPASLPRVAEFFLNDTAFIENILNQATVNFSPDRKLFTLSLKDKELAANFSILLGQLFNDDHLMQTEPSVGHSSAKYQVSLTLAQWQVLRAEMLYTTNKKKLDLHLLKNLRSDRNFFIHRFVNTVIPPIKHPPLRTGKKKKYTVTGEGIFNRSTKPAQYSKDLKEHYSKMQSTSMGDRGFYPPVMSFGDKSVGVVFGLNNALLSNRLFVDDTGSTVLRPYDFKDRSDAINYHEQKNLRRKLFAAKDIDEFLIEAKKTDPNGEKFANEVLARLRWNHEDDSCFVFIHTDNLESRLIAQDYAQRIHHRLTVAYPNKTIPPVSIIFYNESSDFHLREYSPALQTMDRLEAEAIFSNSFKRRQYLVEGKFEILLGLPPKMIIDFLNDTSEKPHPLIPLMYSGELYIVASLFERMVNTEHFDLFMMSLEKLFLRHAPNKLQPFDDRLNTIFWHACRLDLYPFIEMLKTHVNPFSFSPKETLPMETFPLSIAAEYGSMNAVKILLSLPHATINQDNYCYFLQQALIPALHNGHFDVAKLLLSNSEIKITEELFKEIPLKLLIEILHGDISPHPLLDFLSVAPLASIEHIIRTGNDSQIDPQIAFNAFKHFFKVQSQHPANKNMLNKIFWEACSKGQVQLVNTLNGYVDTNYSCFSEKYDVNQSALLEAALNGHLKIVQLISDQFPDVNINQSNEHAESVLGAVSELKKSETLVSQLIHKHNAEFTSFFLLASRFENLIIFFNAEKTPHPLFRYLDIPDPERFYHMRSFANLLASRAKDFTQNETEEIENSLRHLFARHDNLGYQNVISSLSEYAKEEKCAILSRVIPASYQTKGYKK